CIDSHIVQWLSPIDAVIYNRTASPAFFISDRDLVAEAHTTVVPEKRTLRIEFHNVAHARAPEVSGVVRFPYVRGHWELVQIQGDLTQVEYQIEADPGGALPQWIVNWATERIPFNTIDKLRDEVLKPGYEKDVMILEAAIDWSAFAPATPTT